LVPEINIFTLKNSMHCGKINVFMVSVKSLHLTALPVSLENNLLTEN
jgi:hypothetical protein